MMRDIQDLLLQALQKPADAIAYYVGCRLADIFPEHAILSGNEQQFDVGEFSAAGYCVTNLRQEIHSQISTHWNSETDQLDPDFVNGWREVEWEGNRFDLVTLTWTQDMRSRKYYWLIGTNEEAANRFVATVCRWCSIVHGEILVFEDGCWEKDRKLYDSIKSATFDNLVMPEPLKIDLCSDFERFFASRAEYEKYGAPWKRGVLMHGPAGNGKTHAIKALVNRLNVTCLYVKSFEPPHRYSSSHSMIQSVFDQARKSVPCLLVLEDLDSLVNDENRSFFLNELDGFASNTGIMIVATSNHPERLDPSIIDRPSRFDRKYAFPLPQPAERRSYFSLWNDQVQSALRLTETDMQIIVDQTGGFSYAYLKELWLSSIMTWLNAPEKPGMGQVMTKVVSALRLQMNDNESTAERN
jgi:AAA+ superfamily predicted ATPase